MALFWVWNRERIFGNFDLKILRLRCSVARKTASVSLELLSQSLSILSIARGGQVVLPLHGQSVHVVHLCVLVSRSCEFGQLVFRKLFYPLPQLLSSLLRTVLFAPPHSGVQLVSERKERKEREKERRREKERERKRERKKGREKEREGEGRERGGRGEGEGREREGRGKGGGREREGRGKGEGREGKGGGREGEGRGKGGGREGEGRGKGGGREGEGRGKGEGREREGRGKGEGREREGRGKGEGREREGRGKGEGGEGREEGRKVPFHNCTHRTFLLFACVETLTPTMRRWRSPTTVMTANGELQTREEATEKCQELDLFVTVMLLGETPTVLTLGKLCEDHGYTNHWISGRKPQLTKKGKRIDCNISNYVPFVVPGLSTSSSTTPTPTSSPSSSQDSVFDVNGYTENPVPERSGSASEELRGDPLHKPTETENKNKNEGREEVQSDLLHDLPDWLQDFREYLVDEQSPTKPRGNPAPKDRDTASSSHELPMESRAKVEPGVYTNIPKDPNCDICLKTKNNKGFWQKTCWYSRAQTGKFW